MAPAGPSGFSIHHKPGKGLSLGLQHPRSHGLAPQQGQQYSVNWNNDQPPLFTVQQQQFQTVLVQTRSPTLIIDCPYIAGYGTHHPGLSFSWVRTSMCQESAILFEQKRALYSIRIGLIEERGERPWP